MIQALGVVQSSYELAGQKIFQVDVPQSAVSQIAQLPDVLWIEKVSRSGYWTKCKTSFSRSQTNQVPGHGPVPRIPGGTNYLDLLTSTVGGGMASFTNSATYPIVDIADTGFDIGSINPAHTAFYYLGDMNTYYPPIYSRVVYLMPQWLASDALTQLGCTTRLNENAFRYLEAPDVFGNDAGHGTFVASIVAGYDTSPDGPISVSCRRLVPRIQQ